MKKFHFCQQSLCPFKVVGRELPYTLHLWSVNCFSSVCVCVCVCVCTHYSIYTHTLFQVIFVTPHKAEIYFLNIMILKVTEVKQFAYSLKASKRHSWDLNFGLSKLKPRLLTILFPQTMGISSLLIASYLSTDHHRKNIYGLFVIKY